MGLQFGFQVIFQFERSGKSFFSLSLSLFIKIVLLIILFLRYKARPLRLQELFVNLFEDPLNLGCIMITMLAWSIFYLPITWYMEKIMPGDYGIPLPYYFPFLVRPTFIFFNFSFFMFVLIYLFLKKSYWFPEYSATETLGRINSYHVGNQSFERDPKGLQKTVKIMNLSKVRHTIISYKSLK